MKWNTSLTHSLKFLSIILLGSLVLWPTSTSAHESVVYPYQTYTYSEMVRDIKLLAERYPDIINYKVIGKSEYGRDIYAVSLGKDKPGGPSVFINGSHHAREWLTTNLNMYMIDQYAQAYQENGTIDGYNVKEVLDKTTMWFVPMVNPDGVTLQQSGLDSFPESVHDDLIRMNDGSTDFTRWKSNAKGVDLNRNYNADWKNIQDNRSEPSWAFHKGVSPHSSSEVRAIVNFTKSIMPEIAVPYHSAGKVIYWNYKQTGAQYDRDHRIAREVSNITGYQMIYAEDHPSGGGMTDWFISKYHRPGLTMEIGNYPGPRHLSISEFNLSWEENKSVPLYATEESYQLYEAKFSTNK